MTRRRAGWIVAGVLVALALIWPWQVAGFILSAAGVGMALNGAQSGRRDPRR